MDGPDGEGWPETRGIWARFDDLSPDGLSTEFTDPTSCLVATVPAQVGPLLRAVEEATASGCWAVGFLAYEAASGLDPSLATRQPALDEPLAQLPLAWFALFPSPRPVPRLQLRRSAPRGYRISGWRTTTTDRAYRRLVAIVREQIAAGETYQCNLTLPLRAVVEGDLFELYRDLALAQRGAYNAFLDTGRFVVASASPELFFDWSGDRLTTRPMKGTAARGRWAEEDATRGQELIASGKDRAENVMIVDLLRNDLGKVAEPGSVEVPALCTLERFETVWQLTSTVSARPRPGVGLEEVLRALFPCGSVTGAPKARTMALIAELEGSRRGAYCGAVGLVAPPGAAFRARFNVAIRTVVVDRQGGDASYGTGGGITWDSHPSSEHAELVAKAAILRSNPEEFQLLETMAFRPRTGIENRDLHLARLRASAEYFGFGVSLEQVRSALQEALGDLRAAARVRLLVDREGRATVQVAPMPRLEDALVRLALDQEPVDSSDVWLYHKTTRRSAYSSREARHPEADAVIMINQRGELTEATVANLALHLDGRWCTPPLESGCLPGIRRGQGLASGQLQERVIGLADLGRAQGIALISSLRGWRPAAFPPLAGDTSRPRAPQPPSAQIGAAAAKGTG
ncbi:MAG TPA: aminodeoxychorismate synthase component I [Candidatus Dormibacteraeota bacterium]|nr:aminodeoxychorismate synthase component I [Candidatus Dormibacteraeota bacterium]